MLIIICFACIMLSFHVLFSVVWCSFRRKHLESVMTSTALLKGNVTDGYYFNYEIFLVTLCNKVHFLTTLVYINYE